MKFLTTDELKEVKEMMTMTVLGQMLMEDEMKKGIEKSEFILTKGKICQITTTHERYSLN